MPTFTETESAAIIAHRAAGLSWVEVARAIHRKLLDVRHHAQCVMQLPASTTPLSDSARAIRDRARRATRAAIAAAPEEDRLGIADDRQPLPPGHPATWNVICSMPYARL